MSTLSDMVANGASARTMRTLPKDRLRRVGLYLGPVLFTLSLLLPQPPSMMAAAEAVGASALSPKIAMGMLLWVLVWWVTECVPLGLAALTVPLVFSASGIVPWKTALTSMTDPIIWIFMAGFVLAASFRKWKLDRRISVLLADFYKGNDPRVAAFFVCCLPTFLLTVTGSITASTSVVFPFLISYLSMIGVKRGSRYSEACMLALAQAATAGAMLLLISTPPNLIAKATVEEYALGHELSFFDWLVIGTPHALVGLGVSWAVTFALVKPEMKTLNIDRMQIAELRKKLGSISRAEKLVLGLLLLAVTLWIFPSIVKIAAEMSPRFEMVSALVSQVMPEAMPAVLVILLSGLIRVGGEPLLQWKETVEGIDWNVVFLFGGGIALGIGIDKSGLALWVARGVAYALGSDVSAWAIFAVSALLGFALSYAASNTAAALLACPMAASIAIGSGMNPVGPIVAAALGCSVSTAIPSTTPPMAIVYSSGYVKIWNMFKVGIISDLLRLAVLIIVGPSLVDLIL